jgi:hypothetical protein
MGSRKTASLVLAALLVVAAFAGGESQEPPLRNEDIVRMLVAGRPLRAVIESMRGRDVDFDLSDEMLLELRSAEVPEQVIQAMRARQAEVDRARPAPPEGTQAPSASAGRDILHVRIRGGLKGKEGSQGFLLFPERANDELARWLQLGPSAEDRAITDAAVFLACTTADHVPDQWRSKTPLGRDFVSAARHQMLAFHPGATSVPAKEARRLVPRSTAPVDADGKPLAFLQLSLPGDLTAELESGVAHDLILGVAIRTHGIWMQVASTPKKSLLSSAGDQEIAAQATQEFKESGLSIDIRFDGGTPKQEAQPGSSP